MTATVPPFTCPHSTYQAALEGVVTVYADGCRTTNGASGPRRFWCGPDEMSKPVGVSITEGEYLADWDLALVVNEDESIRHANAQRAEVDAAHAEALILNTGDMFYDEALAEDERLTAETHPDTPETREYLRSLFATEWRFAETYEPCGCLSNSTNAHRASCPEYLGEVPWSDRVDD